MFADVISRDGGAPWGVTDMTSEKWRYVPTRAVLIANLIATQPGVLFEALASDMPPVGGDPYPHVIEWRGRRYLEDGHTRTVRRALAGHSYIVARVLVVP